MIKLAEENKKRKTYTSSAVKNRYNKKVYSTITVRLKKDLVKAFDEAREEDSLTRAEFVRSAINQYLENREK